MSTTAEIQERHAKHVLTPWVAQGGLTSPVVVRGEGRYLFDPSDEIDYDPKLLAKHATGPAFPGPFRALLAQYEALPAWSVAPLEQTLRALAEEAGVAAGKVIHPVRFAVSGRDATPGLFEVLELLGRERTLARMRRFLDRASTGLV